MRSVSMTTATNSGGLARALGAAAEAFGREFARREPAGSIVDAYGAPQPAPERGSGGEDGDPSRFREFRDGFCARWRMPELR